MALFYMRFIFIRTNRTRQFGAVFMLSKIFNYHSLNDLLVPPVTFTDLFKHDRKRTRI